MKSDELLAEKLGYFLNSIDPDSSLENRLRVGKAIFTESTGSDEGLALFDQWSSMSIEYEGLPETKAHWRSFRTDVKNPATIETLIIMAADAEGLEPCVYQQRYHDAMLVRTFFRICDGQGQHLYEMEDQIEEQIA